MHANFSLRSCIRAALVLALCGPVASVLAQHSTATPAAAPAMQVTPGDDFYAHANGDWIAATAIPPDRGSWGVAQITAEQTSERILQAIDAAQRSGAPGDTRRVADFYRAFMDEAGIEARGIAPLRPVLRRIAAIRDRKALVQALAAGIRADVDPLNATNFETENLFGVWIAQGLDDPDNYVPYLLQGGLGLGDRSFYLEGGERMDKLRTAYRAHIAAMFKLAGYPQAAVRAARVFDLERRLAQVHATREESADVRKANNIWRARDFAAKAPGIDWQAFFASAGLDRQDTFIVYHPDAIRGSAALVAGQPVKAWQDWLTFHEINRSAAVLPRAFFAQHFDFYGRTLDGTPQPRTRAKRALAALDNALPDAVGKLYVDAHFPPQAKARVQRMVVNIVDAFHRRIDQLDWMAPATKAGAHAKLKSLYVGVGYPDRWLAYDGLDIRPDDAFGNVRRSELFHYRQELARLGTKVDATRWSMPAHVINAVNMPLQNALNFPAGILQAPFFELEGSDAANYGGIGAVIGHEISHSFDDQGAQFDARGRLRDWWTAADAGHFKHAAARLVDQYNRYHVFPDLKLNGQLTLSENLADLAGLAAALDAYRASLGRNGATPAADREFFLGYARSWRSKTREAVLRNQVATDGHAPDQWRTYTVRNLDAWYTAFDVQPGQALYLPPAQRVKVW